jgi:hypothetical protein
VNRLATRSICVRLLNKIKEPSRRQKGMAVPIVLAVVALGAVVITPFLTHAATNLQGMGVYRQIAAERYAADAGIEQAIWNLTDGTLISQLDANGGTVSYGLGYQVNGYTPALTVTQTGGGGGGSGSTGNITKSKISSFLFAPNGVTPKVLNVSGNIFALVYRDGQNGLITLKTLNITINGVITQSALATLTIASGYEPDIITLTSGYFAIVYRGASNRGYVRTVQISVTGAITSLNSATYNSTTNNNYNPRIIHAAGEYYAIVYRGASNRGYVQTLRINTTGSILNSNVSLYNYVTVGLEPCIVPVSGNFYAIAFRDASNRGNLVTVNISSSGVITQSLVSSLLFNSTAAYTPEIINISGTTYAVAYLGPSNLGYLTTVSISSAGLITSPAIATQIFDPGPTAGYEPNILPISGSVYAIIFRGVASDGWLRTWTINPDGSIASSQIDSYEFDTSNGYEPFILPVSGSVYMVVYRSTSTNAYAFTLTITTDSSTAYSIQSVAGGTTTTASVSIDNNVVTVSQWQINR